MKAAWLLVALGASQGAAAAGVGLPPTGTYAPSDVAVVVVTYAADVADTVRIRADGEVRMSCGSMSRVEHLGAPDFDRILRLALRAAAEVAGAGVDIQRDGSGRLLFGVSEDTTRDCGSRVEVRVGSWRGDASCAPELLEALGSLPVLAEWRHGLPNG